ncbi:helix-turn-helix domain protein [Paraburkholderia xenovorans LB400]|uniref:helix-turn-helix domain-containing protein n=1 Tax=Paraburkholderia xenovorans TaxID=36873 RepID=UPI0004F75B13|nr:AraC family transcriptional regulator [Paraburkholderia xenovorans]AIP34484.1 helix-turn-helix domain protein [Paraburkholderia xenovorans LB400]
MSLDERSQGRYGAFRGDAGDTDFAPLGASVFVPAGQTFHVRCAPMRRRVICCMFDADWLDELRDWPWEPSRLGRCRDLRIPAVREAMFKLAHEALAPGFGARVLAESLLLAILVQLARHFHDRGGDARERGGTQLASWQLRLIRERVEGARGPSPGVTELARACRISARHLARTFRNSTGSTLGAFIADARVRQAKALLAQRDVMIKAVAFECGFQSPAAFGAAFRKITGRTPREYRLDMLGLQTAHDTKCPFEDSLTVRERQLAVQSGAGFYSIVVSTAVTVRHANMETPCRPCIPDCSTSRPRSSAPATTKRFASRPSRFSISS